MSNRPVRNSALRATVFLADIREEILNESDSDVETVESENGVQIDEDAVIDERPFDGKTDSDSSFIEGSPTVTNATIAKCYRKMQMKHGIPQLLMEHPVVLEFRMLLSKVQGPSDMGLKGRCHLLKHFYALYLLKY